MSKSVNIVKEHEIGKGVLRFDPSDRDLFGRFCEAAEKIRQLEKKFAEDVDGMRISIRTLCCMNEANNRVKTLLQEVFAGENDIYKILGGANVMAVEDNGERMITNLLQTLTHIFAESAEQSADDTAEESAVEESTTEEPAVEETTAARKNTQNKK